MEEISCLPPRTQAPGINYGTAVGSRLRPAKRGIHHRSLIPGVKRRQSSGYNLHPFQLVCDLDAGCRSGLNTCAVQPRQRLRAGGSVRPNSESEPARWRPMRFLTLLGSIFHFVTTLAWDAVLSGIPLHSSNATILKITKARPQAIPL